MCIFWVESKYQTIKCRELTTCPSEIKGFNKDYNISDTLVKFRLFVFTKEIFLNIRQSENDVTTQLADYFASWSHRRKKNDLTKFKIFYT